MKNHLSRSICKRSRISMGFVDSIVKRLAASLVICMMMLCGISNGQSSNVPNGPDPNGSELRTINLPIGQAALVATRLGLQYRGQSDVQISFDAREDRLIVMAPPSIQQTIAKQVNELLEIDSQAKQTGQANDEFSHRLRHLNWQAFEREFQKLSLAPASVLRVRGGQVAAFRLTTAPMMGSTVEVNRNTGVVRVQSSATMINGWKKVIQTLDAPANPIGDQVTTVLRLRNAEPAPIQRAIRLLGKLEKKNAPKRSNNTRVSNQRTSPIQTVAFQDAELPAPNPDQNEADQDSNEDGAESGSGVIGDTQIEFVPELGTIIIKGAKRDVQRVMDVIKEIEKQSEVTKPGVEVVQLQHADSNAVATLLKQLYEDVLSARQGEVSITSLDAPNALLLIGRAEAIKSLLELIQKIDQPLPESDRLRIFRLQHASALDAEQTIRDFFTNQPGEDDDLRPGLGSRVRVLADYRTNSLIISASPRDMEEVSRLIGELDIQSTSAQTQIKVFPLNNALAEDLATVIEDAITGNDSDDSNLTNPSTSLSIVNLNSPDGQMLDSGILAGATVTADSTGNALVVRATAASMPLIAELIRQLDQSPNIDSLVKVFTIENGDALQLTTALVDLFGDDAASGGTSVGSGNLAALPPSTSSAESSLVPLRFSTDQRTNSIIASGSAEDLEVVESILLRLDSQGFAERITEVIWLRHQTAGDIATALQTYVQQRTQTVNTIQQFQQGLGPYDLPDRDLIVVAEPVTNSLLLSVAPRLYEDVRRLIDRLDRRPPMVLIKVVLAEVSLGDTFEIGGEFGLQDSLVYDRGITSAALGTPSTPGFNFNNAGVANANQFARGTVAATGISSLGVGTTAAGGGPGGFVLSAASDSVSLLLRTLQTANRLQILSRPQIMTLDNTLARVQVGRTIARVTDILNNGISGTQVVTEDIPIGLILEVRPRVGADGLIVMDIDATRSQRDTSQGTQIPVAGDLGFITIDDILETTAQSVVAAYSGQTVIFGGLIQKERTNISRRVPFVSEIPLIGTFFKFDRETELRSETLIIMTPMLVTGDEDLEYVKQTESSRMSWCLADVVEMHGDVGLNGGYGLWGPAIGQTIYPDIQPTVDDIIMSDDLSVDSCPPSSDIGNLRYRDSSGYSIDGSEAMILEDGIPYESSPYSPIPVNPIPGQIVPGFTPNPAPPVGNPVMPYPTSDIRNPSSTPTQMPNIKPASVRSPILDDTKLSSPMSQVSWLDMVKDNGIGTAPKSE
ncbi:secretin N-terminal domain-containing protein [Rubripirellula obstinata]|nr:secretin N-terminal domain-containing protein [Rubripirellula obstinata]